MTETEWFADTTRLCRKTYFLRDKQGSKRRARLFACACCYRVWHFIQVEEARRIVGLAEAYADGEVTAKELEAADDPACFANLEERLHGEAEPQMSALAYQVTLAAKWLASPTFDMSAAGAVVEQIAVLPSQDFFRTPESGRKPIEIFPDERELTKSWELLHDIVGNPFRPVIFDPAWRTDQTVGIATKMYDERNFDAMPILADALQDAGCDHPDILGHCRGDGPHVRGCWVVDMVLGKE